MNNHWPVLSYEEGKYTFYTLHMWTQIVGKIKLAVNAWHNHSWHVTLHITPTGLSTLDMGYNSKHFQIDFDFMEHKLKIATSEGEYQDFNLHDISVAEFYRNIFDLLKYLQIDIKIYPVPVEIVEPIPFKQDTVHATYDETHVKALHQALLKMKNVFTHFRGDFKGKSSPVHFFWGSFDLALSRFSGRKAPKHPGGIPNLPDWVAEEAYSHEVASCGFWPGNDALPEPAFYSYQYPEPDGYKEAGVLPKEAYYHETLREFILPYKFVQQSSNSEEILRDFINSTYATGAKLAGWNRTELEI
jgi:hypothetical protein